MANWYPAHNYTAADPNSLQAVAPDGGDYTGLNTGDMCLVYFGGEVSVFVYDSTSAATQNIPLVVTPDGNSGNGRWLKKNWSNEHHNGFDAAIVEPSDLDLYCTIGVSGTTFTITHVQDYNIYVQGAQFTITGNDSVEITDVEGLHVIYFDNTGDLAIQAPGGSIDDIILENCIVAIAYWDATNNSCILLFDERHGNQMSPATHYHLHETFGAKWDSGLSLSGFSVNGDGTSAAHAQFDLAAGTFHDEDLEITIAADSDATIDTFYRLGAGGPWRKLSATANYPVADPQTGTRMDWNDYNGGTWQLAEVTNGNYVLTHYFATADTLGGGVIGIMGQAEYGNLPQAQAGAETELNSLLIGDLPLPEILPIATVIWQTGNTYTNQVAGAIHSVSGGGDYFDWRTSELTGAGVSVGDHESLTGLLGGATADHYHLTGAQESGLVDGDETELHTHPRELNLIINGDMAVDQRQGTYTGLTATQFTLDRWKYTDSGTTSSVVDITQDTDVPTGEGFRNSLKLDVTTAESGGSADELHRIIQPIEASYVNHLEWGDSGAKDLYLSFWFKSDTKTGTLCSCLFGNDGTRYYITEHTVSDNNWNQYTVAIPGDVSGTINNDTGTGLTLMLVLNAGATFNGGSAGAWAAGSNYATSNQDNFLDSATNNLWFTGIQLVVGTALRPYIHEDFATNILRCQRYYCKSADYVRAPGTTNNNGRCEMVAYSTSNAAGPISFPVAMRSAPTVTLYDDAGTSGQVTDTSANKAGSAIYVGEYGFSAISSSSLTAGSWVDFHFEAESEL